MLPRSILKRSSPQTANTAPNTTSHGVHFPPSPSLCSTFSAHSPSAYDRSPIVVSRNTCALPERGGRTYNLDDSPSRQAKGSTRTRSVHPRALAVTDLPQLIPDLSSESEESDASPVSMYNTGYNAGYNAGYHPLQQPALSFLPHPHTEGGSPPRRKKSEASSSPKRKELERMRPFTGFESTSDSSSPSTDEEYPNRSPSARRRKASYASTFSPFSMHDDGCLGGF